MNTKTKRRLVAVTGVIVVVLIVVLALVGGSTAAQAITVAQAADGSHAGERVQVSGNVVENSYQTEGNVLTFALYDPEGDESVHLQVSFDGGVSSTFGNDITAICTGTIGEDGVLQATELVTKCPSKYENSTDALTISALLEYGEDVYDKPVKVAGAVKEGTLGPAGDDARFVLVDSETADELPVYFNDALSEEVADGSALVVTGTLSSDGRFTATEVALEG